MEGNTEELKKLNHSKKVIKAIFVFNIKWLNYQSFFYFYLKLQMPKSKPYENIFFYAIIILLIAAACIGLWLLKTLTFFPITTLIIVTILSFLITKNKHLFKGDFKTDDLTMLLFIFSIICALFILFYENKQESYLNKLLLDGKVVKKEVFKVGDGEETSHYKNEYEFIPKSKTGKIIMEIISWALIIISISLTYLNYRFFVIAQKQNGTHYSQKKQERIW